MTHIQDSTLGQLMLKLFKWVDQFDKITDFFFASYFFYPDVLSLTPYCFKTGVQKIINSRVIYLINHLCTGTLFKKGLFELLFRIIIAIVLCIFRIRNLHEYKLHYSRKKKSVSNIFEYNIKYYTWLNFGLPF